MRALGCGQRGRRGRVGLAFRTSEPLSCSGRMFCHNNCLFLRSVCCRLRVGGVYQGLGRGRGFGCSVGTVLSSVVCTEVLRPHDGQSSCGTTSRFLRGPSCGLRSMCETLSILKTRYSLVRTRLCGGDRFLKTEGSGILCCSYSGCCFRVRRRSKGGGCKGDGRREPGPVVRVNLFVSNSNVPLTFSAFTKGTGRRASLGPLRGGVLKRFKYRGFVCYDSTNLKSRSVHRCGRVKRHTCVMARSVGGLGGRRGR